MDATFEKSNHLFVVQFVSALVESQLRFQKGQVHAVSKSGCHFRSPHRPQIEMVLPRQQKQIFQQLLL